MCSLLVSALYVLIAVKYLSLSKIVMHGAHDLVKPKSASSAYRSMKRMKRSHSSALRITYFASILSGFPFTNLACGQADVELARLRSKRSICRAITSLQRSRLYLHIHRRELALRVDEVEARDIAELSTGLED